MLEPVANLSRPFCMCLSSYYPCLFPFISESPPCSVPLENCQPSPFQPWLPPYLKLSSTVKLTSWGPGSSWVFSSLITQASPGLLHLLCPQLQPAPGPWSLLSSRCVCVGGGTVPGVSTQALRGCLDIGLCCWRFSKLCLCVLVDPAPPFHWGLYELSGIILSH